MYEYIISLDQNLTLDRKKLPTLRENYPVPNPIRVLDPALSPELSKMWTSDRNFGGVCCLVQGTPLIFKLESIQCDIRATFT